MFRFLKAQGNDWIIISWNPNGRFRFWFIYSHMKNFDFLNLLFFHRFNFQKTQPEEGRNFHVIFINNLPLFGRQIFLAGILAS